MIVKCFIKRGEWRNNSDLLGKEAIMEQKASQLIYELAAQMYIAEVVKSESWLSEYSREKVAEISIESARTFVEKAIEKGLVLNNQMRLFP
jgi:hypothetical protein